MSARLAVPALLLLAGCASAGPLADADGRPASAMSDWAASCADWDEWDKPGPPFRIDGNSYYVGTCGISAILIAGPEGHVLIDSGTQDGAEAVLANIGALGFDPRDVRTILMSHEHFDHIGGMARLQAATGATIIATSSAASVLRSGAPGAEDPQARSDHPPFTPVTGRIETLDSEAPLTLSDRAFKPLFTPGHTPGAMSWQWQSCEGEDCRTIVYADSLSPVSSDEYRFSDHPEYVAAYRDSIARIAQLDCDILLTPHPSASGMRDKLLAGDLAGGMNCANYAASIAERLDERLAREADGG